MLLPTLDVSLPQSALSARRPAALAMVYHHGAWLLGEIASITPSSYTRCGGRAPSPPAGYTVYVRRLNRCQSYLADQVLPMGS